jgi:hypothetical protein
MKSYDLTRRQEFGILLITFCTGFPGLLIAGYMPEVSNFLDLSPLTWVAVSALGTAAGASLYVPKSQYWYVGFLSGLIGGPGALLATYFYSSWRTSMYSVEIVLSSIVGGHAGILMYQLWYTKITNGIGARGYDFPSAKVRN